MPVTTSFEPQFLSITPGPLGQRFAIHHPGATEVVRGLVVYVHPFAEEMNKSRRMAAMQARLLAQQGFAVLQMDLLGCGDSAGDFGDASWAQWVDDVVFASHWLRARHAGATITPPLWLWGLRAGCLLATAAATRLEHACGFVFWQPPTAGRMLLQQFLRLKAAGELLGGHAKATMELLRGEMAAHRSVDVAGYTLSPALCLGLDAAHLQWPGTPGHALWFEVATVDSPTPAPASVAGIAAWREAGWRVDAHAVGGPPFWQTAEIEDAPALLSATASALVAAAGQATTRTALAQA